MGTLKVNNIQSVTDGSVTFPQGSISSQPIIFASGTASNPSISFSGDTDTGLYRIDANKIGISTGGSKVLELDPNTFSTFQGGIERFRISSNGQISTVVPDNNTLYNGYMCRAWVNFNGTLSGTITPRASGNISSVVKNATGNYIITFLTPMPDTNYSLIGSVSASSGSTPVIFRLLNTLSANNLNFETITNGGVNQDQGLICMAVFR